MSKSPKTPSPAPSDPIATAGSASIFISHDHRDADLADAFGKLLKSVSAGMLKAFRSSDKTGADGIDFGDEWYKRLMEKLQATSDVVCLFTERSIDRPWILFEAGVAKGKLNTPVLGVALGVPLTRVSTGPFYQFQNCDDSEADLAKLINQLARRVPNLELDADVVRVQIAAFKSSEELILKKMPGRDGKKDKEAADDNPLAKLAEEMKSLPSRVAERLSESSEPFRRRRFRRIHPMMIDQMMHMATEPGDPMGIMLAASLIRDESPWLYEVAMEVYRTIKAGDFVAVEREISRIRRLSEMMMNGPFLDELSGGQKDVFMYTMEFPRILERAMHMCLQQRKPQSSKGPSKANPDEK